MGLTGKERANRAFEAMEELGLNKTFINPILRELLKVYNNEWCYIEAENYRLLADQAFEQQESVVKTAPTPSPRQTGASLSASPSAAVKGKKQMGYREAVKPSGGPDMGGERLPLLATVKIEKGVEEASETLVKTAVVERGETKVMSDKHEVLKSTIVKLEPPSASTKDPSSRVKIDAQSLEETLKRVSTGICAEIQSTAVVIGTQPTDRVLGRRTRSQTSKDNNKAEQSVEKVETVCAPATQFEVPDSCTTNTTSNCHVFENFASEPGCDRSAGAESDIVGQRSCSEVVQEESEWQKPVNDEANVLLLLADNYSEDDDEPKVAVIAVADSTVLQSSVEERQDEPPLAEGGEPDSCAMQLSIEGRPERPLESIENEPPEEGLPEQPPDMVLSIEEEPEQLDPLEETDLGPQSAIGADEGIRPRFILDKKEVAVAADEDSKPISTLMRHEVENNPSTAKRELSDPQELTQLKRVKYDAEPKASSKLPNGCIDVDEVSLDSCHIWEEKQKCATPPGISKSKLTTAASPIPASFRKKSVVAGISNGANRRKFLLDESPSPEASPLSKPHVTNGVSVSTETNACPTSAEVVEEQRAATAGISTTGNGTCESVKVYENGASAAVVVNTDMNPEHIDDELQESRKKLAHSPADISRGTERVPISYVNDYNSDVIPDSFKYVPGNTVFQDAYVNFSLARVGEDDSCGGCAGDCLKAPYPCCCTRDMGGLFAYTKDGLLRDELLLYEVDSAQNEELKEKLVTFCQPAWECPAEPPKKSENCKGHLSRKFIKECWHKCGCTMDCGNRVVQRGITRRLQIFFTQEGKGWGLRTLEQLPAGAFVCEYAGEILTNIELDQRNNERKRQSKGGHTYPILLDGDWCSEKVLKDEEALCLDATNFGNVARFINHRCLDANLIDMPVTIESQDRHYYHVAFFTSRAVKAMEELTWDYKIDFDDNEHPIEAFRCLCKSPFCRGSSGKKHRKLVKKFSY